MVHRGFPGASGSSPYFERLGLSARPCFARRRRKLRTEIERTRKAITELEAEKEVATATKILKDVLSSYPDSEAAKTAKTMLGIPEADRSEPDVGTAADEEGVTAESFKPDAENHAVPRSNTSSANPEPQPPQNRFPA